MDGAAIVVLTWNVRYPRDRDDTGACEHRFELQGLDVSVGNGADGERSVQSRRRKGNVVAVVREACYVQMRAVVGKRFADDAHQAAPSPAGLELVAK